MAAEQSVGDLNPKEVLKDLVTKASPFWGAERVTAIRFLETHPTAQTDPDVSILALQGLCYKEAWGSGLAFDGDGMILGPIKRLLQATDRLAEPDRNRQLLSRLEGEFHELRDLASYRQFQSGVQQVVPFNPEVPGDPSNEEAGVLVDESKHFYLFMKLLEDTYGISVTPLSLKNAQPSADLQLQDVRTQAKRKHKAVGGAASHFTEGGGSAIFHGMQQFRTGTDYQRQWARVGNSIYREEVRHLTHGAHEVAEQIHTQDELSPIAEVVGDISWHRVLMRNQIFGNPLTILELREIKNGNWEAFIPSPLRQEVFDD